MPGSEEQKKGAAAGRSSDTAGVGTMLSQQALPQKPPPSRPAVSNFGPSLPARPGGASRTQLVSQQARLREQRSGTHGIDSSATLQSSGAHTSELNQPSNAARPTQPGVNLQAAPVFRAPVGLGSTLIRQPSSSAHSRSQMVWQSQLGDAVQSSSRQFPGSVVAPVIVSENGHQRAGRPQDGADPDMVEWPLRRSSSQAMGAVDPAMESALHSSRSRVAPHVKVEESGTRRPPGDFVVSEAVPDDFREADASVAVAYAEQPRYTEGEAALFGGDRGAVQSQKVTRLPVICNGNKGIFLVERQVIVCLCAQCEARAQEMGLSEMELSPTDFERHSGSCTSKKWKYTVKVLEETSFGEAPGVSVGSWLEKNAPVLAKGRAKLLGYSSIFGDVAPSQAKPVGRKTLSKAKGRKKAAAALQTGWREAGLPKSLSPSPDGDRSSGGQGFASAGREESPAPTAGVTAAALTSPSGKKWLSAADSTVEVPLPIPLMREGPQYQADIPNYVGQKPQPGREEDDRRAGLPGPSAIDALALAATHEKQSSDALHIDAVADPEYHPGAAYDVRNLIVERGQRTRRKPRWLTNTLDPEAPKAKVHPAEARYEAEDNPLSWRAKSVPKRRYSGGESEERDDRKRARSLSWLPPRQADHSTGRGQQSSGPCPQILQWQVLNDGFMRITVSQQGQVFTGALMPQPDHKPEQHVALNGPDLPLLSDENTGSESEGWGASRGQGDSRPSWNHAADANLTATSDPPEVESYGAASKPNTASQPKTNQNRRTLANRDYERLQAEGPPPDARCALCRLRADPHAGGVNRTEEPGDSVDFDALERQDSGLGPFLLVRVSAIMNAWVHMQCALWSPEVYVNNSGGVERASEAIRRGRMIKCKLCGEKGATLGCHKRSCRASFHLPCARQHHCLLQGCSDEPYLVTCREHSKISNELELVPQMPVQPDQKVRSSPDKLPSRSRSVRMEAADFGQRSGSRTSGWNQLPKMSASLDTLSAAALAARNANLESAANPLAAQHFGGTVGQSVLRPGRCAVCVVQRKGVCGTQTAPKKCLRRIALSAAGREIPDAPPGWRTRRPVAHWPAAPVRSERNRRSSSPADYEEHTPRGSEHAFEREDSLQRSTASRD